MVLGRPRFRRDLLAVPVEAEGQSYVEVRDPRTRRRYCFYDFEYRVALAFDGLPLDKVISWVKLSTGLEFRVEQLEEFASRLRDLGLLEAEAAPAASAPAADPAPPTPPVQAFQAVDPPTPDEVVVENVATPEETVESAPPLADDAGHHESTPPLADDAGHHESAPPLAAEAGRPQVEAEARPTQLEAKDEALAAEWAATTDPEAAAVLSPQQAPSDERPAIGAAQVGPVSPAPAKHDASLDGRRQAGDNSARNPVADSTAFPVLPAPRAAAPEPAVSVPQLPRAAERLPGPTKASRPAPIVEDPSARRRTRRSFAVFAGLGVLAAAAVLAAVLPFLPSGRESPLADVRTMIVAPGSILRYFDGTGTVEVIPPATLEFPASGKVTHIAAVGSKVALGDIVAAVEIARRLQNQLSRQRERLAFSQQMAEAMHQIGNTKEEERQANKVQIRSAMIAKTLRALADVAVIANHAGQVEEAFAREGDLVRAHTPALRLGALGVRVQFEFSRDQAAKAERLAFCQIEVEGYVLECVPVGGERARFSVELASVPSSLVGKAARLARARFDGATLLPASAIVRTRNRNEVLVVSPQTRVEIRPVALADEGEGEAVVVQGLDPGDRVIVEPASNLRAGVVVGLAP